MCVWKKSDSETTKPISSEKAQLKKKKENEEAQHFTGTFSAGTRAHAWKPEGKMTG